MGKRVMRPRAGPTADYPHKSQQLSCPWTRKPVLEYRHGDYYYGNQGTDVTLHHHLPPPKHSYDPALLNAPAPYFGREGCDVTKYQRYISGMNPPTEDYYYGIRATDISGHLNTVPQALDNPLSGIYWGRPKSYITDPSVSPSQTPPYRPLDGKGTHAAVDWPAQSREDQVPLGKPMNKLQSVLRALARSQKAGAPPKPRAPRGALPGGEKKQRYSPGQPIGRPSKEFQAPPSLKVKIPKETDGMYWGRTKSYITDYAVSPTLTPPPRPFDGEGARDAMTFVPVAPQLDDKILLGKAVSRMGRSPPTSAAPVKLESPKLFRPTTAKLYSDVGPRCKPCAPSKDPCVSGTPATGSGGSSVKISDGPCTVHSPMFSPLSSAPSSASPGGRKKCPQLSAKAKARREENIRWRDQISSAKTSERRIETPCCDKKKPRGIPRWPALADIKCPNIYTGPSTRPKLGRIRLGPGLHQKVQAGKVIDPHHDQEWHGRCKNYIRRQHIAQLDAAQAAVIPHGRGEGRKRGQVPRQEAPQGAAPPAEAAAVPKARRAPAAV